METILVAAHIFICIFLIILVLLQAGKGADIGAVFGGASQAMFGGRGPASFLNKMTIVVSLIFLLTAVGLAKMGQHKGEESVIGKVPVGTAPAAQPTEPVEQPAVPTTEGTKETTPIEEKK